MTIKTRTKMPGPSSSRGRPYHQGTAVGLSRGCREAEKCFRLQETFEKIISRLRLPGQAWQDNTTS